MSDNDISQEFGRRIAVLRRSHKITLDQLADRSGVSRSMLSQIERGMANPTLAVAARIAEGFGLSIAHLVEAEIRTSLIEIVGSEDEQAIFADKKGCRVRTLSPLHREKDVEFYELAFSARGTLDSDAHFAGTREILTVASGSVTLTISGEDPVQLSSGDSANYPADRRHSIANENDQPSVCYLVVTYS